MNKNQNRNRIIDTEDRLTVVRGKGDGGLGEIGEGIREKTKTHRLNSMVVTRGEPGGSR